MADAFRLLEPEYAPWEVHDHPGRPLDPGAMLCSCVACEAAVLAQAKATPGMVLGLVTECDRIAVSAGYLAEVMATDRTLAPLLYVADDRVRWMYVSLTGWFWGTRRWWSLTCDEDETAAGRRHPRHRVAKKQSKADRARRDAEMCADEEANPPPQLLTEADFTPVAAAVLPWRRRERRLLAEMREWALEHGRSVDLDLVALVLAAKDRATGQPLHRWARTGVNRCLAVDVPNWCSLAQVLWPEGVPEALWQLLDFLVATDRLDPASDPLAELRKPLQCYGGLDDTGQADQSDDGSDDPPRPPCECYVTYRGPTHGETTDLAAAGERLLRGARPLSE
jgi:hypothetical protein